MSKYLKRFFGVFLAVCMAISTVYVFADRASVINISTLTVDNTGLATVIGNVTNAGANTQVTCLAMTSEDLESTDKIFGIDQVTVGNNGTFLVKFRIPYRFANQKGYFRFGTDADADAVLKRIKSATCRRTFTTYQTAALSTEQTRIRPIRSI